MLPIKEKEEGIEKKLWDLLSSFLPPYVLQTREQEGRRNRD
jgi:hypothetical protein